MYTQTSNGSSGASGSSRNWSCGRGGWPRLTACGAKKARTVKIATDMVSLAYRDFYDAAILVSGDGDLAPAVQEIRRIGRIVENAIPRARRSWHLVRESSRYIPIDRKLFDRCRLP